MVQPGGWRGMPYYGQHDDYRDRLDRAREYERRRADREREYYARLAYEKAKEPPKRKPRKREVVSEAKWCDAGNHAFSSNDPKRHRFSETKMEKDPEYGGQREVTTTVDVCGPCWDTNNPFQQSADKTALQADAKAPFSEGGQDENYLRGYRDGVVKGETLQ
jgi:hypothetical protein